MTKKADDLHNQASRLTQIHDDLLSTGEIEPFNTLDGQISELRAEAEYEEIAAAARLRNQKDK